MFKLSHNRKGRGTRDQIANMRWIIEKAREFQKNIYFCFIDYAKAFDCVVHNKADIDAFLELSCFFDGAADVGNLISGSSAFLKPAWTSGSSQLVYKIKGGTRFLSKVKK